MHNSIRDRPRAPRFDSINIYPMTTDCWAHLMSMQDTSGPVERTRNARYIATQTPDGENGVGERQRPCPWGGCESNQRPTTPPAADGDQPSWRKIEVPCCCRCSALVHWTLYVRRRPPPARAAVHAPTSPGPGRGPRADLPQPGPRSTRRQRGAGGGIPRVTAHILATAPGLIMVNGDQNLSKGTGA